MFSGAGQNVGVGLVAQHNANFSVEFVSIDGVNDGLHVSAASRAQHGKAKWLEALLGNVFAVLGTLELDVFQN